MHEAELTTEKALILTQLQAEATSLAKGCWSPENCIAAKLQKLLVCQDEKLGRHEVAHHVACPARRFQQICWPDPPMLLGF
jgi:hypothetical protein